MKNWADDQTFLEWVEGAGAYVIANELKVLPTSCTPYSSRDGIAPLKLFLKGLAMGT